MSVDAFPAHESTRKRRRWGCTCGCVGVLIVLLVGGAVLMYGVIRPHRTFPKPLMLDASVNGFGVLRIDSTDEGQGELFKFLFKRAERAQVQGLSESDAKLMSTFLKVLRQFITTLVQTDCPVYLAYTPEAQQESLVTVVPLRNRLSWILLRKFFVSHVSLPQDQKAGADVYPVSKFAGVTSSSVMALSKTEFIYSDDVVMLNRSLDYRATPNRDGQPSEKLQERVEELSLDKPPAGEDLALMFANEPGRFQNLFQKWEAALAMPGMTAKLEEGMAAQKMTFNDILALKFSGDLVSADRAKIELTLYFRQADQAAKFATMAKAVLPTYAGKREGTPFQLKQDVRTRGTPVVVSIDISGLRTWLESIMPAEPAKETPAEGSAAETPAAEAPAAEPAATPAP